MINLLNHRYAIKYISRKDLSMSRETAIYIVQHILKIDLSYFDSYNCQKEEKGRGVYLKLKISIEILTLSECSAILLHGLVIILFITVYT